MNNKTIFQEYYSKFKREAVWNSVFCGVGIGAAVAFILAVVGWFIPSFGWVALAVGIALALTCSLLFYYKKFAPTAQSIARRLDEIGLQERVVTMNELVNDTSYVAMRQREDAKEKLSGVRSNQVHLRFSVKAIATSAIAFGLCLCMTCILVLTALGIVPSGIEWIDSLKPQLTLGTVNAEYTAAQGGTIDGKEKQEIQIGSDAEPVLAIAEEGWMFDCWSDGFTEPSREDTNLQGDISVKAKFVKVPSIEDEKEDFDAPNDAPLDEEGSEDGPPGDEPGSGIGGNYDHNNNIYDNKTYYRDDYEYYYEQAMAWLSSGKDIPDELREFIETYFGIIQ